VQFRPRDVQIRPVDSVAERGAHDRNRLARTMLFVYCWGSQSQWVSTVPQYNPARQPTLFTLQ
jgi:hypothetical protein